MNDLIVLSRDLLSNGKGAYLGEDRDGSLIYLPKEQTLAVLGAPRSGKSTRVFVQSIAAFPGLAVCTSTRAPGQQQHPDIIEVTESARQQLADASGGNVVHVALDPASPTHYKSWNFLEGCKDWKVAEERARFFVSASLVGEHTVNNADFFRGAAIQALAPVMMACALNRKPASMFAELVRTMRLRSSESDTDVFDSMGTLKNAFRRKRGATHPASLALANFLSKDKISDETRQNVMSVIGNVILPSIERCCPDGRDEFTLSELFDGDSTLYLQARSSDTQIVAPFVAALVGALVTQWRTTAVEERPTGCMLALDEVANIAPIHTLPELMSTAGGDGITVILGVQDIERMNAIWPGQGYGIVEGGSQLLLGGYRDAAYLKRVSELTPLVNRYHTNVTVDHEALKAIPHRGITTTDLIESATRRARSVERVDPRIRGLCDQNFLRMERANMLMKGQQIGEIGDSFEEWAQHYNSVVSIDHVGTLRHALEPHELFELPDGQALAISGTNMTMLKLPGWWESPLWREVLGREA